MSATTSNTTTRCTTNTNTTTGAQQNPPAAGTGITNAITTGPAADPEKRRRRESIEQILLDYGSQHLTAYEGPNSDAPFDIIRFFSKGSNGDIAKILMDTEKGVSSPKHHALKVMKLERLTKHDFYVESLLQELRTLFVYPKHPNVNHGAALFHTDDKVLIVVDLCEGPALGVEDRLLLLAALYCPRDLADHQRTFAQWEQVAREGFFSGVEEYLSHSGALQSLLRRYGARKEPLVGGDLREIIVSRPGGRLDERATAAVMRQLLQGIAALHDAGLYHRDIKCENVAATVTYGVRKLKAASSANHNDSNTHGTKEEEGAAITTTGGASLATASSSPSDRIVGVEVTERLDVELIDHGFVHPITTVDALGQVGPVAVNPHLPVAKRSGPSSAASPEELMSTPETSSSSDLSRDGQQESEPTQQQDPAIPASTRAPQVPVRITPCGTEAYMAPEMLRDLLDESYPNGEHHWATTAPQVFKADVFAAGVVAYTLETGALPFAVPPPTNIPVQQRLRMIRNLHRQGPRRNARLAPGGAASAELRDFISLLLQADPRKRPSAREALAHPFVRDAPLAFSTEFFDSSATSGNQRA